MTDYKEISLAATLEQLTNAGFTDLDINYNGCKILGKDSTRQIRVHYLPGSNGSDGRITNAYEITERKIIPLRAEGLLNEKYVPRTPA